MNSDMRIKIGAMIQEYRKSADLSQAELAEKLGYSTPQFISLFERGLAKVPIMTLGRLVKILDLPEKDIFKMLVNAFADELRKELESGKRLGEE